MSNRIILIKPQLAQATPAQSGASPLQNVWTIASGLLLLLLLGLAAYTKFQTNKLEKQKRFEEFKNRELQKKLKLALNTISKMEKNPDLIHSREFNLDYLKMRMDEEQFHFIIMNQIKIKVKEKISIALRPAQAEQGLVGVASGSGRQVDEMFDVEYDPSNSPKGGAKRVLFRIQVKLTKLPTQPTSATISQIIECMQKYMSQETDDHWQPTIQGRIASMHWDQKAKPTPLLVLEQSNEGVNVTFRTSRIAEN